jgi:hypothetical protein
VPPSDLAGRVDRWKRWYAGRPEAPR